MDVKKMMDNSVHVYCFLVLGGVEYHLDNDLNEGGLTWGFMNP